MNGTNGHPYSGPLIGGLAHVNLTIPRGTLDQANDFYGNTLGLTSGKDEEDEKVVSSTNGLKCQFHTCRKALLHGESTTIQTHPIRPQRSNIHLTSPRFDIADSGQMIHIAFNDTPNSVTSTVSKALYHYPNQTSTHFRSA